MDKPKIPAGKIEIDFVGIFDADKVPKYAYVLQKIQMYTVVVTISCFIAFLIIVLCK